MILYLITFFVKTNISLLSFPGGLKKVNLVEKFAGWLKRNTIVTNRNYTVLLWSYAKVLGSSWCVLFGRLYAPDLSFCLSVLYCYDFR